jgi:hypothetical protein
MKTGLMIKYAVATILFAGSGWISCGQGKDDPAEIEDEPDRVVKIENLQTRLRIVEARNVQYPEEVWSAGTGNILINYATAGRQKSDLYFGYTDAGGQTLLCEVTGFPEAALQWEGEVAYTTPLGTVTEVNIQMSGTVRLYTDERGEKYGKLDVTSLEPAGPETNETDICNCESLLMQDHPLSGVEAYLFKDAIPYEFAYSFMQIVPYFVCWIVFDSKTGEAWIHYNNHNSRGSKGDGKICNFPDLVKDSYIPENGCKVHVEGLMYDYCDGYASEGIMFNYVLTKFKRNDYEKNDI